MLNWIKELFRRKPKSIEEYNVIDLNTYKNSLTHYWKKMIHEIYGE